MKKIAILGSGCAKCKQLEENTKAAVAAIGNCRVWHGYDSCYCG